MRQMETNKILDAKMDIDYKMEFVRYKNCAYINGYAFFTSLFAFCLL